MANRDIDFVRVRIKGTNVEKSVPRAKWESNRDAFSNTRKRAVNSNGDPLPPTTVNEAEESNQVGQSAEITEES